MKYIIVALLIVACFSGDGNVIIGNGNTAKGNNNQVYGHQHKTCGDDNIQIGFNTDVDGSDNSIVGANHKIRGDGIKMFGPDANYPFYPSHPKIYPPCYGLPFVKGPNFPFGFPGRCTRPFPHVHPGRIPRPHPEPCRNGCCDGNCEDQC